MGSDESATYADLVGTTDEFKIYNYARTAKQIVEDMNAGHPAVGSPVGSAVGHWRFDEGQGITTNNSGNGGSTLNGTLTTMASPATSTSGWTNSGKFNKALVFDGSNDYVSIPYTTSLGLGGSNPLTVSAWVYWTGGAHGDGLFPIVYSQIGSDPWGRYSLFVDFATSKATFSVAGTSGSYVYSNAALSNNQWYHITGTWDGTTQSIFVNGVIQNSATPSIGTGSTFQNLYFGTNTVAGGNSFGGSIDEVKIYNYALTSDEVKLDYNQGVVMSLGTKGTNSSYATGAENQTYCIPGDSTSCAAPVTEWNFDEGSGTSMNDSSGNANTGTWTGTGSHWVPGKFGKAGNFNGSDDYVNIPNSSSVQFTNQFTAEGWFYVTSTTQNGVMGLISQSGGVNQTWKWFTGSGYGGAVSTEFHTSGGGITPSFGNVSLNTWEHYAETYDGSSVKLYKNGRLISTTSLTGNMLSPTNNIAIGCDNYSCAGRYYKGQIDQVRIFNYVRTPAQVAWDYNRGKPVGWWSFDECSGSVANDRSGNSNTGTITIGATGTQTAAGTCQSANTAHAWYNGASGKLNSSLNFDGTDDHVSLPTTIGTFSVISVAGWFKNSLAGTIISALNGSCGDQIIYSDSNAFGQLCFSNGTYKTVYSGINTLDNQWHQGVTTFDGTYVRFYLDGRLVGTSDAVSAGVTTHFTENNKVGSYLGFSSYFTGQIDDVRIYNYALTVTQIKDIYNGGAVRFGP